MEMINPLNTPYFTMTIPTPQSSNLAFSERKRDRTKGYLIVGPRRYPVIARGDVAAELYNGGKADLKAVRVALKPADPLDARSPMLLLEIIALIHEGGEIR